MALAVVDRTTRVGVISAQSLCHNPHDALQEQNGETSYRLQLSIAKRPSYTNYKVLLKYLFNYRMK